MKWTSINGMTCNALKCNNVEISRVGGGPNFKEKNDYDL
jgi:hypothetical protein